MQEKTAIFLHKFSLATEPIEIWGRRIGMDWPFVGTEALADGVVTRHDLAIRYDAIYRNVYVPRGRQVTPAQRAHAAWLWSRRRATVVGISAAAMHNAKWIDSR